MERPIEHNFDSKFNVLPITRELINREKNKTFNQIISENLLKETPEQDRHYLVDGTKFRQVKEGNFRGGVICGDAMVKRVLDEDGKWLSSKNGQNKKYMSLTEFEYWFIRKGNTEKEYRLFEPGEIFSAPEVSEKVKTPLFIDVPKEVSQKLRKYEEKKYFISTIDKKLYGTNQNTFEAFQEEKIINRKKHKVFIPNENILIFRNGYVTIAEGKPVKIKKIK